MATSVLAAALAGSSPGVAGSIEDMISPVSMPTVNEDPRVTTEHRPFYLHHGLSDDFVTDGGNLQLVAVQARLAIPDRIGFIATKDGFVWLNPDGAIPDEEGFANIAFGFKGVLSENEESASILTLGLRYETPWGAHRRLPGER